MPIAIKGLIPAAETGKPTPTEKPIRQRVRMKKAPVSKPKRAAAKPKRKPAKRTKARKR